jgi:hypothetical protein
MRFSHIGTLIVMSSPGSSRTNRTDAIAREAARLVSLGSVESIEHAIGRAAETLGFDTARLPTPGRVRQHLQAMTMQQLGAEGYNDVVRSVLDAAEQVMTVLEMADHDARTLLMGRAARGHVDGGVTLHIRLYCDVSVTHIAALLVEHGYVEPVFETAETRFGRLDRIRLYEEEGEIVITRCMPDFWPRRSEHLFKDERINAQSLTELRQRLARDESE